MNAQSHFRHWFDKCCIALAMMVCVLAGIPVHAATTFPDNPLLTGGAGVAPNILLILDDSGSMGFVKMPEDVSSPDDRVYCRSGFGSTYAGGWRCGLNDDPTDRSYINNTIYYNPGVTYQPWRTSSTNQTARLANANVASASTGLTDLSGSRNLAGNPDAIFYIPNTTNPGTNPANYDKYRIAASNGPNSVNGAVVQKLSNQVVTLASGTIATINNGRYSSCIAVSTSSPPSVQITTSGGTGNGYLYVYSNGGCFGGAVYSSTGSTNAQTVVYQSPPGTISFQVYANTKVSNITYTVTGGNWQDSTTPSASSQAAELQNFANWYQYARTRNKTAKSAITEAFGRLGSNYRVGFDTIWNGGYSSTGSNPTGSLPTYPIPVAQGDGLFKDDSAGLYTNRSDFYSAVLNAGAYGGTPLHGALQRSGRYFQSDAPWKDSSGTMLSCRQNYSILTTDGYWNDTSSANGYTNPVGNADANSGASGSGDGYPDTFADTLADVAYYYWKNDLRPGMTDNVRSSTADPAKWQHMVTFGISIGSQGTLNTNNPPPNPWTVNPLLAEDATRIDDLWHAALNGHGRFVVATNVNNFSDALASALSTVDARTASGSNIASTSTKTNSTTLTFVAGYTSGTWVGDLVASPFNAALTGVSDTPLWRMSKTFAAGGANANFASRTILTSYGGSPALLSSLKTNPTAAPVFTRSGGTDAVTASDNIDYISGVQTLEIGHTGGNLRQRAYPFGDIVDSSPDYVADSNTLYVGANDGMMHGIDASSGQVRFSYVPAGIDYSALSTLSSSTYTHRYFVDGQIDTTKISASFTKNILVGALGRGGKGVYALDVTNPAAMGTTQVLWDKTFSAAALPAANVDADMGYVLGAVRIRKARNGNWYAFVPNGIESQNGSATLFVYQIDANGNLVSTTKLTADAGPGNGLMSLGLASLGPPGGQPDGIIDTVYGGDLKGNVWKWDFSGTAVPSSATKIFQAVDSISGNPQPITGGIGLAKDLNGNIFIGFGTGRYISNSDVPGNSSYVMQTQSLYGIIDTGTLVTRANLQPRTIPFTGTDSLGRPVRGFENYSVLPSGKQGWYIDLGVPSPASDGERVVTSPTIVDSAMWVSSIIPASGSDCSGALGSGYINAVNVFTGTNPNNGSYYSGNTAISGANGTSGNTSSINLGGGMPTQVNVTSNLATAGNGTGTGDGTTGSGSGTGSAQTSGSPSAGKPQRVVWRELLN